MICHGAFPFRNTWWLSVLKGLLGVGRQWNTTEFGGVGGVLLFQVLLNQLPTSAGTRQHCFCGRYLCPAPGTVSPICLEWDTKVNHWLISEILQNLRSFQDKKSCLFYIAKYCKVAVSFTCALICCCLPAAQRDQVILILAAGQ